jgi:hypothetical protein
MFGVPREGICESSAGGAGELSLPKSAQAEDVDPNTIVARSAANAKRAAGEVDVEIMRPSRPSGDGVAGNLPALRNLHNGLRDSVDAGLLAGCGSRSALHSKNDRLRCRLIERRLGTFDQNRSRDSSGATTTGRTLASWPAGSTVTGG